MNTKQEPGLTASIKAKVQAEQQLEKCFLLRAKIRRLYESFSGKMLLSILFD